MASLQMVQNIAAELDAAKNRVTLLEQQLATSQEQINQLTLQTQTVQGEHQNTHTQLVGALNQIQVLQSQGGSNQEFRLVDPKTMVPPILGSSGGPPWRKWSESTRAFVEMLSERLAVQLKAVEGREQPLTEEELREAQIPGNHAAQMSRYLRLRTDGNDQTLIKAAQDRNEHPLEQWRRLSWEHDPKGLGSDLVELHEPVSPSKVRAS